MNIGALVQVTVSGLLLGGIFALVALGLTLIFGVMGVINFAHGQLLMLAMYTTYWAWALLHIDPLIVLPVNAVLFFGVGAGLHTVVIKRVMSGTLLTQMFATFGLAMLLGAGAQFLWSPNPRGINRPVLEGSIQVFGIYFDRAQALGSIGALLAFALVYVFLMRTELGLALRATAQDGRAAAVMGIDPNRMHRLAWGIAIACLGVAGTLLANYSSITPNAGDDFALISYVVVALGGFGSIPGALLGGLVIGVTQALSGFLIGPQVELAIIYAIYILVVWLRPKGLFGNQ